LVGELKAAIQILDSNAAAPLRPFVEKACAARVACTCSDCFRACGMRADACNENQHNAIVRDIFVGLAQIRFRSSPARVSYQ
jgi:hypothetical protein